MMLDRLRVADLKDEIVSMQSELNSVLFEQHQRSQQQIKSENPVQPVFEPVNNPPQPQSTSSTHFQPSNPVQTQPRPHHNPPNMQEPSQILKAKQEQKLFENIKNDIVKVEHPEIPTVVTFNQTHNNPHHNKQSKFDRLKNETPSHQSYHHKASHQIITELKEELDDFDIESEITPNLIMKKCENVVPAPALPQIPAPKKNSKTKDKEREYSPLSEYFNKKPAKNKVEPHKTEMVDGSYDEWLSIQISGSKKKEEPKNKNQPKINNDLAGIFDQHVDSPKSVEKQLDDLFSSTTKSSDLMAAPSPLAEFFNVEPSGLGEKTVENRLEALFGGTEDDSRKSNQQDLVETRLEQLFQGSVAENDESALDNASFLYKNTDMTYEMIQKQIQLSTAENSSTNSNKRQWNGDCDLFTSTNSSLNLFQSPSSPSSKRPCTSAAPVASVSFDNKWIEDSFDFATDIMTTAETSGDDITKHRSWNGTIDQRETMIGGIQSPQNQFHMPSDSTPHQSKSQTIQNNDMMGRQDHMMDTQIPNLNYEEDVDDISRQVQNAIDSILNLQSSDPLTYQLDSSFLELNSIAGPSGAPNSPIGIQQSSNTQQHQQQNLNQYQMHQRSDHPMHNHSTFTSTSNSQKQSNMPKRKYDDIGDCLIGGSNLDDSPSALAVLAEPHGGGESSSSASVGEFVNNLLSCEEKSITS